MKKTVLLLFIILMSCEKNTHGKNGILVEKPTVETYFIQNSFQPQYNGCCTFSTILQLDDNHRFSYYYLNNQGDYSTTQQISGTYELKKNSVIIFIPKKDSVNQDFGYNSTEFFKNSFVYDKQGISSKNAALRKISFADIQSFSVTKTDYTGEYKSEKIVLKKDSLLYDKFVNAESVKKNIKLSSLQLSKIKSLFEHNFWTSKPNGENEKMSIYSAIDLGNGDFDINANPVIANYFLNVLPKDLKIDN